MKYFLFFIFLAFGVCNSNAQKVELLYNHTPLDRVLLDIREKHQVQFSFENSQLSSYHITTNRSFSNVEEALEFLFRNKPLAYEKIGQTYLVYYLAKTIKPSTYLIKGNIFEKGSSETLPYAHLNINGVSMIANKDGKFSYKSLNDSIFNLKVSFLGFHLTDTTIYDAGTCTIELVPVNYELNEIKVKNNPLKNAMTFYGSSGGEVQLSNYITPFLPGNGDNSVFNLLRLHPGILAAGEQSSDLIIWGSYEGQSQLLFDGITLFAMKNYNDNISAVNPFLAKSVNVLKGGYGVEHNGVVGGIVDVTGLKGNNQKFSSRLNINNQTLNGMITVPLFKRASLVLASRKTFYELYDQGNVAFNVGRNENNTIDKTLYPDYNFQDYNLKLSGEISKNDQLEINGFLGADNFTYALDLDGTSSNFQYAETEQNKQLGWSAQWNHQWRKGGNTRLLIAKSQLEKQINNLQKTGNRRNTPGSQGQAGPDFFDTTIDDEVSNFVSEQKVKIETKFANIKNHHIKWGIGYQNYNTSYQKDSLQISTHAVQKSLNLFHAFISDRWVLKDKFHLEMGILNEYAYDLKKNLLQPRFSLGYNFNENIELNFGSGRYRQYLTRLTQMDAFSTVRYFWMLADNEDITSQDAFHNVLGLRYKNQTSSINLEFFHKKIDGLTRYVDYSFLSEAYSGNSHTKGFDIFLEKRWDKVQFWGAYTYSQTLEHFDYFPTTEYQRALHDQRHELKLTLLAQIWHWNITSNYVLGSGFPNPFSNTIENNYQRLDFAATHSVMLGKFKLDTGISILNVTNRSNLKYDNFYRLPDETSSIEIQAEGIPFSPTVFLNITY